MPTGLRSTANPCHHNSAQDFPVTPPARIRIPRGSQTVARVDILFADPSLEGVEARAKPGVAR